MANMRFPFGSLGFEGNLDSADVVDNFFGAMMGPKQITEF